MSNFTMTPEEEKALQEFANLVAGESAVVMSTLLDEIMFDAPDCDKKINITAKMVTEKLSAIVQDKDLSRYIL